LNFVRTILNASICVIQIFICFHTYGQNQSIQPDTIPFSSNLTLRKGQTSNISFTGFYRFLGYIRNQTTTFPNNSGKTTAIMIGDFYREPMLLLKMKGLTKDEISFGADFMINSLYKGVNEDLNRELTLELGLNLKTSISTRYGKFNIKTGGVSWYRQSRLTVWGNQSFNRTSIYDRRPQTPLTENPGDRYTKFYNSGLVDQGVRYGNRAFQGLFVEGLKLPLNFHIKGVIGKSNFNRSEFATNDNFTGCFKVKNILDDSLSISYQHLNSTADIDSIGLYQRKYKINTFEIDKKWDNIRLQLETGIGQYSDLEEDLSLGDAFIANLKTTRASLVGFNLQVYRLSPQFVNVTGNLLNSTVLEVFPNIEGVGASVRLPFKSPMVGLGFPVNNRQGGALNADFDLGKFKINGGVGIFSEIESSSAGISFIHNVNSETISRLNLFAQNWGPYNFLTSNYRRVFETVELSDGDENGNVDYLKYFNTIELQTKYNLQLFNRNIYLFTLTQINSCQKSFEAIPIFSDDALINQSSLIVDVSCELNPKTSMVMSYGLERVKGNELTDLDEESGKPRNQSNRLIGIGLDYKVGDQAMIFIRQNFYKFSDPNFSDNQLQGTETMLELKINFN
tara:strand:+ start:723 stop:2588 length:1866 start_codon:yes stop_codon:yes gene_type:complete